MTSLTVVEPAVKFHISLNVRDLGRSIAFYRVLFGVEPTKRHDDYAKFEIDDPPVVFSLAPRAPGPGGSLSHLGLRVGGAGQVAAAKERLEAAGLPTQEQCGTVCGFARQDKVWVSDPDGNFWEVYHVEEDVEPALVRRSLDGPAAPAAPEGPVVWEHYVTEPLAGPVARPDGSVDEVRLTGTFNAALDDAARAFAVREAVRVLRPGGKVVVHALVADRPLPGEPPKLPGLAAMVSRVPARAEAAALLTAAGLVGLHAVKLTEAPWFVHGGVGLREVKLVAYKPLEDSGEPREVLYKGPFAEATADGGHTFRRGERVRVPAPVWEQLRRGPSAGQFVFFEPGAVGGCR